MLSFLVWNIKNIASKRGYSKYRARIAISRNRSDTGQSEKWEENLGIYRRLVGINPKFDKLITELSAVDNEGSLDKEATSYDDIFDPYRSAEFYHHKSD